MTWTEGNNWKAIVSKAQIGEEFEYKYLILNPTTMSISKWETGDNRKLSIKSIEALLNTSGSSINQADEYNFEYQGTKMLYMKDKQALLLYQHWRN